MSKPRIKIRKRRPVFSNLQWVCSGFDQFRNWTVGVGFTPAKAFYNWKSQSSYMF